MMKKADREYLSALVENGCVICQMPAEVHHIRSGMGMGQRNDHRATIPLCPMHHRNGGLGVAIHAGRQTWEGIFGTEAELLEKVNVIHTSEL